MLSFIRTHIFIGILILFTNTLFAQGAATPSCEFWKKVRYGGGLGLNIGGGFTNISLSPTAIYDINQTISVGAGLQGSYVSSRNNFSSFIYGASLIGLANVSDQIQVSADLEQLKVNTTYDTSLSIPASRFWNTALFLGAGYSNDGITIGVRYNVLFKKEDNVYSEALMPFIRVFF